MIMNDYERGMNMGQKSQIYLRANGKLVFANYYGWNYGERMISRARYGIEWVKYFIAMKYDWVFSDPAYITKMRRVFDVNFDMKDVAISQDIVQEHADLFADDDFNDYVFNKQGNNDGQLYVDIKGDKIYYCFRDWTRHSDGTTSDTIMSASEYMDWDAEDWENSEYITDEGKAACRDNIKAIEEMAELMTMEQLDDFIGGDYEPKPF